MTKKTKEYYKKIILERHKNIDIKLLDVILNQLTRLNAFQDFKLNCYYDEENYSFESLYKLDKREERLKTLLSNNVRKLDKNGKLLQSCHISNIKLFNYEIINFNLQ